MRDVKVSRWIWAALLLPALAATVKANGALDMLEQWSGRRAADVTPARGIPIPIPIPVPVPVPAPRPDRGHDEAYRACGRVGYPADRHHCQRVVDRTRFFDGAAAYACGGLTDRGITPCVEAIAEKWYHRSEVDHCARQRWDGRVIDCFRHSGRYR